MHKCVLVHSRIVHEEDDPFTTAASVLFHCIDSLEYKVREYGAVHRSFDYLQSDNSWLCHGGD